MQRIAVVVARERVSLAFQRELRPADAVAVTTDQRAKIRTAFEIGVVHITVQIVEAEHDVGELAVLVRHWKRLHDAAVSHDARLGAFGVAQRVDFNGVPSGVLPKSAFVMVPLGVFDIVSQPVKHAAKSPSDVTVMSWMILFMFY